MSTSHWQNLPFATDVLQKIAPKRVLDVGVGYGRWGVLVRSLGDIWLGRVLSDQWQVHIEGLAWPAHNLDDTQRLFYNKLHTGDPRVVLAALSERWDLVIFDNVFEQMEKPQALLLLELMLAQSQYVLINIPLGSDASTDLRADDQFERHLLAWTGGAFEAMALPRPEAASDLMDRTFGLFILSQHDPQGLGQQLPAGAWRGPESPAAALPALGDANRNPYEEALLLGQLQERLAELQIIKRSRGYRLLNRLQRSSLAVPWRGVVGLVSPARRSRPSGAALAKAMPVVPPPLTPLAPGQIRILCSGQHHPRGQGNEVWLLAVESRPEQYVDWKKIRKNGPWELRTNAATASGYCLFNSGQGYADFTANAATRLTFMTHPWSGVVELHWSSGKTVIDLYSGSTGNVQISPLADETQSQTHPETAQRAVPAGRRVFSRAGAAAAARFSQTEREWIDRQAQLRVPLSVAVRQWRGIHSSASQLFSELYNLEDNLDEARGAHFAQLFAEAHCPAVVIQGFPLTYRYLVAALRKIAPRLPVYVIWHGSFLQTREDYDWQGFCAVEQFVRNGSVAKWGFVKKGMAEIMARRAMRTGFVMNLVRNIPAAPSTPLAGGPHLGIWSLYDNWRKPPYAMLAAATLQAGATVHASGANSRVRDYAGHLGLTVRLQTEPVEQENMLSVLSQMHLNLYVTLSECAPMLPLESLSAGAPCLLGPNSHYFEDQPYLRSRLVVAQPDDAACIAGYLAAALEERSEIVQAYQTYAPTYNAQARECLSSFLELPVTWL